MSRGLCVALTLVCIVAPGVFSSLRCGTRSSSLEDNRILFCDVMRRGGGVVVLGLPTSDPVDYGLPDNGVREDEFLISQVFMGPENLLPGDSVRVSYRYQPTQGCERYPYDRMGMEVVLYGFLAQGTIEISDCLHIKVYDCITRKQTLSAWRTDNPCT